MNMHSSLPRTEWYDLFYLSLAPANSYVCLFELMLSVQVNNMITSGVCLDYMGLLTNIGDVMPFEMCFQYYYPSKQLPFGP